MKLLTTILVFPFVTANIRTKCWIPVTVTDLDYPSTRPTCPAEMLGGCTAAADCFGGYGSGGACQAGSASYDATCYNGIAAQKAANGCAAVSNDCQCAIDTTPTCPAPMLGGCMHPADCPEYGGPPCHMASGSYDPSCYNYDLTMKYGNGCGNVPTDCSCRMG